MKIEKFSKNKDGMYLLTLEDGNKIEIHEDLILKYELLLSKHLKPSLLEEIKIENKIYEIYNIALKYIKIKLRSKKEIKEYLIKKGYSVENCISVIDMLSNQGYLDDKVYANSYVHDKILMSSYGPNKLRGDLEKLGINNQIIEDVLSCFDECLEKEKIEKLVDKQIKSNHNKSELLLKKKIQLNLLNLGYSANLINQILCDKKIVTDDISRKEYEKLFNKLSKKYSGKELEYKLKQKMYQKGFNNSDYE